MRYDGIKLKDRIGDAQCFGLGFALDEAKDDLREYVACVCDYLFGPKVQEEKVDPFMGLGKRFIAEFDPQFRSYLKAKTSLY